MPVTNKERKKTMCNGRWKTMWALCFRGNRTRGYMELSHAAQAGRIMAAAVPLLGRYFKVNDGVEQEEEDSGVGVERG